MGVHEELEGTRIPKKKKKKVRRGLRFTDVGGREDDVAPVV